MTEVENIKEREKRGSDAMYLMVEFPRVVDDDTEYMIVYYEAVRHFTRAVKFLLFENKITV